MADPQKSGRSDEAADRLAEQVRGKQSGMFQEFLGLLRDNKKWWLTPIIAAAVLLGVLMMLLATPLSPLIYSLF
jgi:hypothetical protein